MNNIPLFQGSGAFVGAVIALIYLFNVAVPDDCISEFTLSGIRYWCQLGGPWVDVNMFPVLVGGIVGGLVGQFVKNSANG